MELYDTWNIQKLSICVYSLLSLFALVMPATCSYIPVHSCMRWPAALLLQVDLADTCSCRGKRTTRSHVNRCAWRAPVRMTNMAVDTHPPTLLHHPHPLQSSCRCTSVGLVSRATGRRMLLLVRLGTLHDNSCNPSTWPLLREYSLVSNACTCRVGWV